MNRFLYIWRVNSYSVITYMLAILPVYNFPISNFNCHSYNIEVDKGPGRHKNYLPMWLLYYMCTVRQMYILLSQDKSHLVTMKTPQYLTNSPHIAYCSCTQLYLKINICIIDHFPCASGLSHKVNRLYST